MATANSRSDILHSVYSQVAWITDHLVFLLLSSCMFFYAAIDDFSGIRRCNISRVCRPCISWVWCCPLPKYHKRHTTHLPALRCCSLLCLGRLLHSNWSRFLFSSDNLVRYVVVVCCSLPLIWFVARSGGPKNRGKGGGTKHLHSPLSSNWVAEHCIVKYYF